MTKIDLTPYVGNDPFRPYLHHPFSFGKFTYSTNGHILIRVPRRPDVPTTDKEAKWDGPLEGIDKTTFSPLTLKLPDAPVEGVECDACEGRGYDHDCPDCECLCDACNGSGKMASEQKISTTVRGVSFSLRYIRMMAALRGVEVSNKIEAEKPLLFKFDGGVGAIMPIRGQFSEHVEVEKAA